MTTTDSINADMTSTQHSTTIEPKPTHPADTSKETPLRAVLELEDGTRYEGTSFGAVRPASAEIVFNTGMVGYPEMLTDPSYTGEIITCTYPMVGNYGVPKQTVVDGVIKGFESERIHAAGLIVAQYSDEHSHWNADRSLGEWLRAENIPAITGIDTRSLTKRLREKGSMLGAIRFEKTDDAEMKNPFAHDLVSGVTIDKPAIYGKGDYRIALIDCGTKLNILRSLVSRGVEVLRVPASYDLSDEKLDGVVISNGPGDPEKVEGVVPVIQKLIEKQTPIFGICMGHQLLARAVGLSTYKLKYGHRGQNQPVNECGTNRCLITSQNHGFAVNDDDLPQDWRPWFRNLNDNTNEGLRHNWAPFRSVQFHPEATPEIGRASCRERV